MVTLAFVQTPATPLSYTAFNAVKAAGGVAAATFSAAQAAAVAGIAGATAAAVGAGIGGFLLGQLILKGLEVPQTMPDPGEYVEFNTPGQEVFVVIDTFIEGVPQNVDLLTSAGITPTRGMFNRKEGGQWTFFFIDGNGNRKLLFQTSSTVNSAVVKIKEFRLGTAPQPITPTKRLPSYAPNSPGRPKPVPATLPIPGFPDFPITPRVVPNPDNDPEDDNVATPPGVIVQIPETGQQFVFTPDGVKISNYTNPEVKEKKAPGAVFLPGSPPATPPCCDSGEPPAPDPKVAEIVCRVKTLQKEILDDGYDFKAGFTTTAQSGRFEEFDVDFFNVRVQVQTRPLSLRIQPSTAPVFDVWYVGWFSWLYNGFPGDRIPLHFQFSEFIAPPDVTGYVFQLNSGCTGFAQHRTRTKRPFIDLC